MSLTEYLETLLPQGLQYGGQPHQLPAGSKRHLMAYCLRRGLSPSEAKEAVETAIQLWRADQARQAAEYQATVTAAKSATKKAWDKGGGISVSLEREKAIKEAMEAFKDFCRSVSF